MLACSLSKSCAASWKAPTRNWPCGMDMEGTTGRLHSIRTLKKIDIVEASLVTFPANDQAQVTTVKANSINTIREFESFLRDVGGFSANEAKRIASAGFQTRDVPDEDAEVRAIVEQIKEKYL